MTLDEKRAALSELEKNFARGVSRARKGDEEVQFDSGALAARISALRSEIAAAEGRASGLRVSYPSYSKGV